MEEEIRDILRSAAANEDRAQVKLGTQISSLFSQAGLDFEIPELRGYEITPPSFKR
jgi:hypothetical protein